MRVLIVDDHPAVRCGMSMLLNAARDIDVVGETGDAEKAVQLVEKLNPDLVILDLRLRGEASGIQACREIKSSVEAPRVLVHTSYCDIEDRALAMLAGADGYLHKGVECIGLSEVVRRLHAGEHPWFVGDHEAQSGGISIEQRISGAQLTPKEREVLTLMLERCSNPTIAQEMFVSLPTVKTHVRNIMRKIQIKRRKELFAHDSKRRV